MKIRNHTGLPVALTNPQKKHLRGLAHHLSPVVMVGEKGLTDAVMIELDNALDQHELVKIRLRGERGERAVWIRDIAGRSGAELVHEIGHVACFFRRNPDKPRISFPD